MTLDPQVNGYAGVDFQQDDLSPDHLERAIAGWRRDGGARFFLTLITDAWPQLVRRLRHLKRLRDAHTEVREAIAGWHVEGPFLSPRPGFHGAHDPDRMEDPHPDRFRELRDTVGDDPLLVTLAPERPGALESISKARSLAIHVSLGHTDASADQLRNAVSAGAEAFTHLGNGCPQQLDRHDNILWRVLDTAGLWIGVIPDGRHVSPALFRLLHRVLPANRIYYTTDAMAAAGSPPGVFTLGPQRLEVGDDGIVRLPGRTHFAGSSLQPGQVLPRARQMLGPMADRFLPSATSNAARWLGIVDSPGATLRR